MTVESTITDLLQADSALLALATGGVYSFDDTGRKGINRTTTPAAFDSAGVILPAVVVAERAANPLPAIADDSNQMLAIRQAVEVWVFHDASKAALEAIQYRVYQLLHAKPVSGLVRCEWGGNYLGGRELEIDAWTLRMDFMCTYIQTG